MNTDPVLNHQGNQSLPVYQDDPRLDPGCVVTSVLGKCAGGDEDSAARAKSVQCTDECLDCFAPDAVAFLVPLCLDVDSFQAQGVLVNDAIDSPVTGTAYTSPTLLCPSIAHGQQQLDDGLFKEIGVAVA